MALKLAVALLAGLLACALALPLSTCTAIHCTKVGAAKKCVYHPSGAPWFKYITCGRFWYTRESKIGCKAIAGQRICTLALAVGSNGVVYPQVCQLRGDSCGSKYTIYGPVSIETDSL